MTRIFFAGPPCFRGCEFLAMMKGMNVLATWGEHSRAIYRRPELFGSLALDSGAYGAYRSGRPLMLGKYIAYLQEHGNQYCWYATLDVIGDAKTTAANWREMLRAGLKPVPVFHGDEPFELLDEYRTHSSLVALGSTPGWRMAARLEWYEDIFARFPHRYHLFRATDPELLKRFDAESVDSSTWVRAAAMGYIPGRKPTRKRAPELTNSQRAALWINYYQNLALVSDFRKDRRRYAG